MCSDAHSITLKQCIMIDWTWRHHFRRHRLRLFDVLFYFINESTKLCINRRLHKQKYVYTVHLIIPWPSETIAIKTFTYTGYCTPKRRTIINTYIVFTHITLDKQI